MKDKRQELKRILGHVEVFALAFGTMVGWGCMMLSAQWIREAGVLGAMLAFGISCMMCILVGLTYAELTSAFPLAGGELAFSYRGLGNLGSWITGWTISFAYICVAAWEGIAFSIALDYLLPFSKMGYLWSVAGYEVYFSWSFVGILGAVVLTIINIIGVRPVAIFQILLIMVMIITGMIFVFGGFAFGKVENMEPLFTNGKGIGMVLIMAPSMFIGFDMVSKSAEEMNMPLKNVAKVLVISIVAACAWYMLIILGTALSAPPSFRLQAMVPVADSAAYAYELTIFGKILIIGGICGIITSWNGFIVGASRIIFAMGRAKMLPKAFGKVHSKYQTPIISIIFVGFLCCLSPLLGEKALVWLVDSASFATVITYLMISISFLMLRKKEPNLRKFYVLKRGKMVGIGAIVSALFFLFWYTPLSPTRLAWPYEWILVISWIILGLVLITVSKLIEPKGKVTPEERELLMFGEKYARERISAKGKK